MKTIISAICIFCGILFSTGCESDNFNNELDCWTGSIHGVNLEYLDTAYVKNLNVTFVYAIDTINNSHITFINTRNNCFTISDNDIGIARYLNDNNVNRTYFDTNYQKCEKGYFLYSKIGLSISNSMETILNIVSTSERSYIGRSELDSFFRYYILGSDGFDEFNVLYDTLPAKHILVNESYQKLNLGWSDKVDQENFIYLNEFYDFLRNVGKDNFFLYKGFSGVSSTGYFLITVNEQFKSDSLVSKFYNRYNGIGFMYSLKSYFPYYIIEGGGS